VFSSAHNLARSPIFDESWFGLFLRIMLRPPAQEAPGQGALNKDRGRPTHSRAVLVALAGCAVIFEQRSA
jgi:hypothetical protein